MTDSPLPEQGASELISRLPGPFVLLFPLP